MAPGDLIGDSEFGRRTSSRGFVWYGGVWCLDNRLITVTPRAGRPLLVVAADSNCHIVTTLVLDDEELLWSYASAPAWRPGDEFHRCTIRAPFPIRAL